MRSALMVVSGTLALSLILLGCAAAGSSSENIRRDGASSVGPPRGAGGTTVGLAIAEAKLEPTGDSSASGTVVFKGVGSTDVQVELSVSGLPKKGIDAGYYAQVHEGSCSKGREHEGREHKERGVVSPASALLRFDRLLVEGHKLIKATGLQAHGGEPDLPKEPPGSIEQPVSFGASSEGTISVVSLLEGVAPRRVTSGGGKYVHVHTASHKGTSPEELACGDLKPAKVSG